MKGNRTLPAHLLSHPSVLGSSQSSVPTVPTAPAAQLLLGVHSTFTGTVVGGEKFQSFNAADDKKDHSAEVRSSFSASIFSSNTLSGTSCCLYLFWERTYFSGDNSNAGSKSHRRGSSFGDSKCWTGRNTHFISMDCKTGCLQALLIYRVFNSSMLCSILHCIFSLSSLTIATRSFPISALSSKTCPLPLFPMDPPRSRSPVLGKARRHPMAPLHA